MSDSQRPPVDEEDWFNSPPPHAGDSSAVAATPPLSVVSSMPESDVDEAEDDWFSTVPESADQDLDGGTDLDPPGTSESFADDEPPARDDDTDQFPVTPPMPSTQFLPRSPAGAASAPEQKSSWFRSHRSAVAVGGAVATVVVLGVGAALALSGLSSGEESPTPITDLASSAVPPSSLTTTVAPVAANSWCTGFSPRELATPESSDAGMSAIASFQTAFYSGDAAKARSFVAPDNSIGSVQQLTNGFAQLPAGSEQCVLAAPVGNGRYEVDLYERHPDGSNVKYRQTVVTTGAPDGSGARIVAINPREGQ